MKGIVDFRYFFDDEIFGESEMPIVEADLHGKYVKTVSDDTIKRYTTEMNDKLISITRQNDGIFVKVVDKDDHRPYNYMWGDFGLYFPSENTLTYVKSERMMKHLYNKFGEEYRNAYITFCSNVVEKAKGEYIENNERRVFSNAEKLALQNKVNKKYAKKMHLVDEEFNNVTGRNPELVGQLQK